uniref:Reticulon-4 receptor-like 2 n=1 Tax=Culex pipiens TaxID=7175 RepID=A0A8D8C0X1_CULPI
MNSYLWTAAYLAWLLALGGRGHGDPIVDLCGENITDANLKEELGKLTRDKIVIDLCDNQLKNFHRDLFRRFDRLDKLVFDGNPDLGFPADGSPFLVIKSLRKLQCIKCGVEKIFNRSLKDLPKIERINLTNNRITDIERDAFNRNRELQQIDLNHNLLERLPNELVEGLTNLEQLDLSFNKKLNVNGDQPFLYSSTLKELKCEGCGFAVIYEQTFAELPNLRRLDLRGNVIVSVQSNAFLPISNLKKLWLQNNQLVSVYAELLHNDKLQWCLDNNTVQFLCEVQKFENWLKFQCQNESQTEVDCAQFTEPPTEPTTFQTEISVFSSNETSTTTTTTTTVTTTTTQVTTSTTRNPPAEPMGISDWYISSYLTIIILTQIGALVILVGVWLKMKKYDSDPELDSLAGTVLNPSTIYKPLY